MHDNNGKNFRKYLNYEEGTVDRSIFVDKNIYKREMEQIFARAWNFMCHESQIPKPGDFFRTYIGEDSVIATRDKEGNLQVLLNTCPHRGNPLCKAEMGSARSFTCNYHGWTFSLDGKLKGVPGLKKYYQDDLNREEWGLSKAAKVESYKGFVFATMDPNAPSLEDYLGDVGRLGLSTVAAHGDIIVVDGIQKNQMSCNWKFAVDNTYDWYHPPVTHSSALTSGYVGEIAWDPDDHIVALGEYGHVISGPRITKEMREQSVELYDNSTSQLREDESWRDSPHGQKELGEFGALHRGHPGIFPNLWIASSGTQLSLRLPRGPECTEIWWFTVLDKNLNEKQRREIIQRAEHFFGPTGLFEQDDGENWDQGTQASKGVVSQSLPFNISMNFGHGKIKNDPETGIAYIDASVNEHGQFWTLQAWADWMSADDWADLEEHHSIPVGTL